MTDISSREYFSIILSQKLIAFRYSHIEECVCVCVYYHVSAVCRGLVSLGFVKFEKKAISGCWDFY